MRPTPESCFHLTVEIVLEIHAGAIARFGDEAPAGLSSVVLGGRDAGERMLEAMELHDRAHKLCFIARSVKFRVRHEASIVPED